MLSQQVAVFEIAARFVFEHSSQHVRSAGHADRSRVIVIVEYDSVVRQFVQVGSFGTRSAVAAHGISRLVVGQQKDDVWTNG